MGLAGRKEKQRFGIDPQNKIWKNDKEAIGFKLLSRMGWKEGKGLGKDLNGMSENIKLKMKNNNFGIGATAKTSDNWLESSFGFDDLLKGLGDQKSAESSDHLLLIIPPSTKKDDKSENVQKLNGRHSHRKKFIINKQVAAFDDAQVNNILGKTRTGEIQHPKDPTEVVGEILTESTESEKKESDIDVIPTVVKTQSVNDYFSQKMAAKGLTLAGMLSGIPDQVAPNISRNEEVNSDKESTFIAESVDVDFLNHKVPKSKKSKKSKSEKVSKRKRSCSEEEVGSKADKNRKKKKSKKDQ